MDQILEGHRNDGGYEEAESLMYCVQKVCENIVEEVVKMVEKTEECSSTTLFDVDIFPVCQEAAPGGTLIPISIFHSAELSTMQPSDFVMEQHELFQVFSNYSSACLLTNYTVCSHSDDTIGSLPVPQWASDVTMCDIISQFDPLKPDCVPMSLLMNNDGICSKDSEQFGDITEDVQMENGGKMASAFSEASSCVIKKSFLPCAATNDAYSSFQRDKSILYFGEELLKVTSIQSKRSRLMKVLMKDLAAENRQRKAEIEQRCVGFKNRAVLEEMQTEGKSHLEELRNRLLDMQTSNLTQMKENFRLRSLYADQQKKLRLKEAEVKDLKIKMTLNEKRDQKKLKIIRLMHASSVKVNMALLNVEIERLKKEAAGLKKAVELERLKSMKHAEQHSLMEDHKCAKKHSCTKTSSLQGEVKTLEEKNNELSRRRKQESHQGESLLNLLSVEKRKQDTLNTELEVAGLVETVEQSENRLDETCWKERAFPITMNVSTKMFQNRKAKSA